MRDKYTDQDWLAALIHSAKSASARAESARFRAAPSPGRAAFSRRFPSAAPGSAGTGRN